MPERKCKQTGSNKKKNNGEDKRGAGGLFSVGTHRTTGMYRTTRYLGYLRRVPYLPTVQRLYGTVPVPKLYIQGSMRSQISVSIQIRPRIPIFLPPGSRSAFGTVPIECRYRYGSGSSLLKMSNINKHLINIFLYMLSAPAPLSGALSVITR